MKHSYLTFKFNIISDHEGADGFPGLDTTIRDPYSCQTAAKLVELSRNVVYGALPLKVLAGCQRLEVYVPRVGLLIGDLLDVSSRHQVGECNAIQCSIVVDVEVVDKVHPINVDIDTGGFPWLLHLSWRPLILHAGDRIELVVSGHACPLDVVAIEADTEIPTR